MTRGGRSKDRDEPERKCLVTGESGGKSGLIRFVIGPEDVVVPDILGRLPGRGLWVTSDRAVMERAVAKKVFSRGARKPVTVPDNLIAMVENGLLQRVIDLLSLARKAGQAIAGYEKVKSWLTSGEARVLIQASDGSERGKTKLRPPDGPDRWIVSLSATELGMAFGREKVIHGALAGGGLTTRVVEEASRLAAMRETHDGDRPAGKGTTTI
ncbi:RNA-binding protein [Pseudoruegeria sp. SK021]|uniref:RNA-binding protein n=1 Tax=Pseudoruegeria sp. SK021 TaxID=1933035 RepID=UPI000A248A7F|nr:RNA-binding protein [Pseudoruegeria sp. SK021]OSP54642.1 hypothetical protein BV911_11625 [Pseudoruegeria sp. SK021]